MQCCTYLGIALPACFLRSLRMHNVNVHMPLQLHHMKWSISYFRPCQSRPHFDDKQEIYAPYSVPSLGILHRCVFNLPGSGSRHSNKKDALRAWTLGLFQSVIQLPPVNANNKKTPIRSTYCPDTLTNATQKWDHIFLASAVPENPNRTYGMHEIAFDFEPGKLSPS